MLNFKQESPMPKIILNSLALVSWSEHEYYLMSFFWCLSIWQCQNVFSFWQNLTLDIKELITPSSGQEWFMHWCLSMDFSLPDKSAVHREKKKVLPALVTSHDAMLRQPLKFTAFFQCHILCVTPAATSVLFSSNILMGKLE